MFKFKFNFYFFNELVVYYISYALIIAFIVVYCRKLACCEDFFDNSDIDYDRLL